MTVRKKAKSFIILFLLLYHSQQLFEENLPFKILYMYIHISVPKNILRKLGVKRSILNEKELTRPIDIKDMLMDDKFPHPSLVNITTDDLRKLFTEVAWEKIELMPKLI